MPALLGKEPRLRVAVSLRRDQHEALREQAEKERHGNVSLIVQRAVDRELERVATDEVWPRGVLQEASVA